MKLSAPEDNSLSRMALYTSRFALRSAQVIIQSRLGEKVSTKCKPSTSGGPVDLFYVNINELPEVVADTRRFLDGDMLPCYPLCVEISLRTPDGVQMVLETWCLDLLTEQGDLISESVDKDVLSVYNRMSLLLKSLVSVTRVTPAYKMSRLQGPDSYVICYRLFLGEPSFQNLGDGFKSTRIGQICTSVGTIRFSVAYRTNMTISPTQTSKDPCIVVKSDHFNTNNGTRRHWNNEDINDLTKPLRPGPFADPRPKISVEPDVERLQALNKQRPRSSPERTALEIESSENAKNLEEAVDNLTDKLKSKMVMTNSTTSRLSINSNLKETVDAYWSKELNAPFATRGPVGELMHFYNQCKSSPPLQSPQQNPTPEEVINLIEKCELDLPVYDELVQSFCESSED